MCCAYQLIYSWPIFILVYMWLLSKEFWSCWLTLMIALLFRFRPSSGLLWYFYHTKSACNVDYHFWSSLAIITHEAISYRRTGPVSGHVQILLAPIRYWFGCGILWYVQKIHLSKTVPRWYTCSSQSATKQNTLSIFFFIFAFYRDKTLLLAFSTWPLIPLPVYDWSFCPKVV